MNTEQIRCRLNTANLANDNHCEYAALGRGACVEYMASARMARTVHENVVGKGKPTSYEDVTLVTQLTEERIEKLYNVARRWSGLCWMTQVHTSQRRITKAGCGTVAVVFSVAGLTRHLHLTSLHFLTNNE